MSALNRQSRQGTMTFPDRAEAGRMLGRRLQPYVDAPNLIVLGIPRGGVPVAFEVAAALMAPLDVFILRKLGVPYQEELAFGAIASGGVRYIDKDIVEAAGIPGPEIERIVAGQTRELERREGVYRGGRPPLDLRGKTVILVDDGIATGASMQAAIAALQRTEPARLVVAVPVAPASTCKRLAPLVDELVCLYKPESFYALGEFYEDFSQLSDEEVTGFLHRPVCRPAQNVS
jgi:putative phosphoribosyl transferase